MNWLPNAKNVVTPGGSGAPGNYFRDACNEAISHPAWKHLDGSACLSQPCEQPPGVVEHHFQIDGQHRLFISCNAADLPKSHLQNLIDQRNAYAFTGIWQSIERILSSAADVRHSWTKLSSLRWERELFRQASSNVRSWVEYFDNYVVRLSSRIARSKNWTREFLDLDSSVLEKDDWALIVQHPDVSVPETVSLIRGCLPDFGEHFENVSGLLQDLRQLLAKVEGIRNHFDWLCKLGVSLLVFFYRGCSLFLSQRSWFLHHSAHPPDPMNSDIPGFGGAGALLQIS